MKGTIRERKKKKGKGGKMNREKLERKTNHERFLTLGNKQRVAEGEVGGIE